MLRDRQQRPERTHSLMPRHHERSVMLCKERWDETMGKLVVGPAEMTFALPRLVEVVSEVYCEDLGY
jgi:hypothetical protein